MKDTTENSIHISLVAPRKSTMFNRLVWQRDRMLLDDLVFRLEHYRSEDWNGGDHFRFYKVKELVDQYANFFSPRSDFRPGRVMELGTYDGGSTAFWYELFGPEKHVALDIEARTDTSYFRRYVESRGLDRQIKTYWQTDQNDKARLRTIVETEFDGPLDLVIDDASHLYRQTRASFETLFPLLRPGGLYIIEDWAWSHWPIPDHPYYAGEEPLTRLVVELTEAAGTSGGLISSMVTYSGFVVVERGPQQLDKATHFNLENHIVRRPKRRQLRLFLQLASKVQRKLGSFVNRFRR
jgi:cephalosporin hydroxylase